MCEPLPLSELARQLGKYDDFFVHVKINSPKLHRWMGLYGRGNMYAGAYAYFVATVLIREEIATMYYELSLCKSIKRFFNDTKEVNPYKCSNSLTSTLKSTAFTITDRMMRFRGYYSSRKVLNLYLEWKEKGYTEEQKIMIEAMYDV